MDEDADGRWAAGRTSGTCCYALGLAEAEADTMAIAVPAEVEVGCRRNRAYWTAEAGAKAIAVRAETEVHELHEAGMLGTAWLPGALLGCRPGVVDND